MSKTRIQLPNIEVVDTWILNHFLDRWAWALSDEGRKILRESAEKALSVGDDKDIRQTIDYSNQTTYAGMEELKTDCTVSDSYEEEDEEIPWDSEFDSVFFLWPLLNRTALKTILNEKQISEVENMIEKANTCC